MAQRLAKGSAYSLMRVGVALLTSFAWSVLINRMLGAEAAGQVYLLEAFILMGATVANLGLVDTALRYVAEGREDPPAAAGVVTLLCLIEWGLGGLVTLLLWSLAPLFARAMSEPQLAHWIPLAALAVLPYTLSLFLFAVIQAHEYYDRLAKAYVWVLPLKVLAAFGALWAGWGVGGLLLITVLAHLAMAITLSLQSPVSLSLTALRALPKSWIRRIFKYAPAMGLLVVLTAMVWDRSETFFLGLYHPSQEVAYYGTAFTLAALVMRGIPGVLGQLLTPISVSLNRDRARLVQLWQQATRHLLAISLPLAAMGWWLAPSIMITLYGHDFLEAAPVLGPLLLGLAFGAVGAAEAAVKFSLERVDLLVKVALTAGALNLLLDWWWIPEGGARGAAYACAVTQILAVTAGTWLTVRLLETRFPWKAFGQVVLSSLAAGLVAAWFDSAIGLAVALLAGFLAYPAALTLSGFWTPDDRQRLATLWAWVRGTAT